MSRNCSISRNISLAESVQSFLYDYAPITSECNLGFKTIGGILSNAKYAWYANGPRFQIIESRTGRKVASWTFGSILRDTTTQVVCLCEVPCLSREIPLLILGLECALTGGVVCIFDILTSKILRVVQVNEKVSSLHVIDCGSNIFPVLGLLKAFDGVVAVGLVGGDVLLIDLCRQCIDDARVSSSIEDIKGEVDARQLIPLTPKDINSIEDHKQRATQSGHHLAVFLNAVFNNKSPHFILKGPKGEDRVHVNKVEVLVTALFYSPQLGSLLVGYNFGAWQIWNIINMTLIYTSPVYEENVPVSYFTVQEPADDPRAFCYVWAIYSHTNEHHDGFPIAVLYSLNYETKDFHEGYGYLYQDLQSCAVRFQTELAAVGDPAKTTKSARCLRLTAFNKGCSSRTSIQESHEDTLTVCCMVWNVWHTNGVDTYMSIFDLNQWYKEQMPSSPQENCFTYLSHMCITDLLSESVNNSGILDVLIHENSINQFIGIQKPEEHYYPTALAYEFTVCNDKKITFIYNKGQQRALLGYFENTGPLMLLKPKEIFQQSIQLGLTPLFTDPTQSELNLQREFLLNIALEQQMTGYLCKCVLTWYNGSFTGIGCSLEFFLNWAWNRAILLKTNADRLCETLFDYSENSLDANNQRLLNSCITQLSSLYRVYRFMRKKLQLPLLNIDIVCQQDECLHMIVTYFEVLQWLMNIGLLPEFLEDATRQTYRRDSISAPYPIEALLEYYKERRSCLGNNNSLLFIDILIENEFDTVLQRFWKEDGSNGYYPPSSLQSLLRTYLIENVDVIHKHCIIIYLFLDLAMALDQTRYKFVVTHLIKFPTVFKISPSITKITQAFWQLDHGDFEAAMDQFLDPLIDTSDLKTWHHRTILNALLIQEQYNFALLYFQVRKPPLETTQDVANILRLYIVNHMIDEAINFSRTYSSQNNEITLIRHIFEECEKTNQILQFVYYPLNPQEEEVLMKYLEEISYDQLEDFKICYYLHRSRYIDIFQTKSGEKFHPSGLRGQKEMGYYDSTMKTIRNLFPKVAQDILDVCQCNKIVRNEASRPKPMSVFVHNAEEQAKYKSTLIHAGIVKAKETWSHPVLERSRNDDLPFISTPVATVLESRKRGLIICPQTINGSAINDTDVSPSKRMKYSLEESMAGSIAQLDKSEANTPRVLDMSKLLTPIVKRKINRLSDFSKIQNDKINVCTPQSILKVRKLVIPQSPSTSATHSPNISSRNLPLPVHNSVGVLSVTPRKSLSRSVVRFEKGDVSLADSFELPKENKSSSLSMETFYSPNTSGNDEDKKISSTTLIKHADNLDMDIEDIPVDSEITIDSTVEDVPTKPVSPKERFSYKDLRSDLQNIDAKLAESDALDMKGSDSNDLEPTPRKITDSKRGRSQVPETMSFVSSSPIRSSLRISSRKSVNRTVTESNTNSASTTPRTAKNELQDSTNAKSSVKDSSSSLLASENFDQMIKNQSFDISYISLSPLQYSTSFESEMSKNSIQTEQLSSKLSNIVEVKNDSAKKEYERSRRSSLNIKSRKSLSRMVLERNASSACTSTPRHSFIETGKKEIEYECEKSPSIQLSSINSMDQRELDRMIKNQTFDVPHCSLLLTESSVDSTGSNMTRDKIDFDLSNKADMKDEKNESISDLKVVEMDVDILPRSSIRLSSRKSIRSSTYLKQRETSQSQHKTYEIEEACPSFNEPSTSKDIHSVTSEAVPITKIKADMKARTFIPVGSGKSKNISAVEANIETELVEPSNEECTSKVIEQSDDERIEISDITTDHELEREKDDCIFKEVSISTDNQPEGNEMFINANSTHNDTTFESDDFNTGHYGNIDIILISESSSSSDEISLAGTNSIANANIVEEDSNENSLVAINIDSERSSLETLNNAILEPQAGINMELPSYEVLKTREKLGRLPDHLQLPEQMQHIGTESLHLYLDLAYDQTLSKTNLELNVNEYNDILCTDSHIHSGVVSSTTEEEHLNALSDDISIEKRETVELKEDDEDTIKKVQNLEERSVLSLNVEENVALGYCSESKSSINESSNQTDFLGDISIDPSHLEDITAKDIFDITDIEKTTCINVTVTDVLDESLTEVSIDMECTNELPLQKHRADSDGKEIKTPTEMLSDTIKTDQPSSVVTHSAEPSHEMRLRKSRLSNTSVESPSNRTPRRRSASVDDNSTQPRQLIQSALSEKPLKNSNLLELNENIRGSPRLRNRRAASVSECISHVSEAKTDRERKRKNKRTMSVTNLRSISEEDIKSSQRSTNTHKQDTEDEQSQIDDLEAYSTTRRLTRHQKSMLERSKGKQFAAKKVNQEKSTPSGETSSIIDDHRTNALASPVSEGRGRILTRRLSQESTSSVMSTTNSASDTGSPKKRKNRSQTPKTECSSPQGLKLRRGRSKSIDEVSVSSQVSKSSRVTRQTEVSDSDNQSIISLRRSTRHRSKTPETELPSQTTRRPKKVLGKILEELDSDEDILPEKRGKTPKGK